MSDITTVLGRYDRVTSDNYSSMIVNGNGSGGSDGGGKYGGLGSTNLVETSSSSVTPTTPIRGSLLRNNGDIRNVTFTAGSDGDELTLDESNNLDLETSGFVQPPYLPSRMMSGLGATGVGISAFTSPLHKYEYHSPNMSGTVKYTLRDKRQNRSLGHTFLPRSFCLFKDRQHFVLPLI